MADVDLQTQNGMKSPQAKGVSRAPATSTASQKRKRLSTDGLQPVRPAPGRQYPANAVEITSANAFQNQLSHIAGVSMGSDAQHPNNTTIDFGALTNHNDEEDEDRTGNRGNVDINTAAADTAAAALSQQYTMNVPQSTDLQFRAQTPPSAEVEQARKYGMTFGPSASRSEDAVQSTGTSPVTVKPSVGSDEWHKQRKDNHKEVERRRRETINEGINELQKIVPNCQKNKGSILQQTVQYITTLKENEVTNIEKWTLEKLITEQAINQLGDQNGKLREEMQRLRVELSKTKQDRELYKEACEKNGITVNPNQDGENKVGGEGETMREDAEHDATDPELEHDDA